MSIVVAIVEFNVIRLHRDSMGLKPRVKARLPRSPSSTHSILTRQAVDNGDLASNKGKRERNQRVGKLMEVRWEVMCVNGRLWQMVARRAWQELPQKGGVCGMSSDPLLVYKDTCV